MHVMFILLVLVSKGNFVLLYVNPQFWVSLLLSLFEIFLI